MADVIKGEMLRGQIDTVILFALLEGDKDSNDIRTAIEEKSDNQYSIKQGTFYSAMQRLVKQGYIKEYRSSAMDGIRRKYYSITPKGNKFLDKNREQWTASKSLVDSLFETEEEKTPEKPIQQEKHEPYVDEFDSFKAFVDDNGEDFKVETIDDGNSYFDDIGADVLSDLNAELEKQDQQLPQTENENTEIIEDKTSNFEENYETVSDKSQEDLFAFDLYADDLVKEVEPELDEKISDEIPSEESSSKVYEEFYQDLEEEIETVKETPIAEEKQQDDDLLIVEDYSPTNKNKYKQILNKILPKETDKKQTEDSPEKTEKPVYYKTETVKNEEIYEEEKTSTKVETQRKTESQTDKSHEKPARYSHQDPSDFSDLYAMANREGFKIRTSYNTNKFVGSEILLSKLVMHSSLVFFIILALECLILNFALGTILNWKIGVKLIILGSLAVFPIVALITYLINKKRSVYEIASFKDAMSVALIITFQLAILILCVALFISVDFNNFKEVTTFILLPFILAINIPLYFILKYSLLSTGKYFTKE